MKVIILGAGAVGSYYGAKLSEKNDVILIGREGHIDMVNRHGLVFEGAEQKTYRLKAATRLTSIDKNTLIILATKVYDNEKTILMIKDKLQKDTVILCVQNGYGAEDIVKSTVDGRCAVLRSITRIGVQFVESGTIRVNHHGKAIIEKQQQTEKIVKLFRESGLDVLVSENIKVDIWQKMIINCMVNPLTALLSVKNKEIVTKELEPLLRQISDECIAVAEKEGVSIEKGYVNEILTFLERSENTSSMRQDILRGKKTEIDYLNGAVVALGKRLGVQTPANAMLACLIRFLERRSR